ncbi:MAG TPA: peptidoglycan bridge formation glycyltransferase FemA/FemB family protein [Candidatus Saccharimonadales bacterium]|nr:peptidoglycan bridge formation glycyltransferase FemA/FemB family protein [Candidatus Saccharimonadales bacterium]
MSKPVMRTATEEEIARWDELVVANPDGGQWLQTKPWADFRSRHGFTPRFQIFESGTAKVATLFLERQVAGFGRFWYASKGPGITDAAQLQDFVAALKQNDSGAFFARLEPTVLEDNAQASELAQMGLKRARQQILKATIVVDLSPSEDESLASFKQKTRYNVRLASRHGVTVEAVEPSPENLNQMYDLMLTTQERAGYFLHTRQYFLDLWQALASANMGQLFFARYQGQVLAGVFAIYLGKKGWYKDGGSVREHTNVMAPYLLQWEVMRWLKSKGVESYDLVGVAPREQAGHHIMDSLEHFKAGFSQNVVEWIGTYDLPLSSKYGLWQKGGERLAVAYHARIKKEFLY